VGRGTSVTYARAETEKAFAEYTRLADSGDWARWAELFTQDAGGGQGSYAADLCNPIEAEVARQRCRR
jgi:hypothetical protein